MTEKMDTDFLCFSRTAIRTFVQKFRTRMTPQTQFEKIFEELAEVQVEREASNEELELAEWADVLVVIFGYLEVSGLLPGIEKAFSDKMEINLAKTRIKMADGTYR